LNKATQAWLKLNAYIYGSQAFAKHFEQPSYLCTLSDLCRDNKTGYPKKVTGEGPKALDKEKHIRAQRELKRIKINKSEWQI